MSLITLIQRAQNFFKTSLKISIKNFKGGHIRSNRTISTYLLIDMSQLKGTIISSYLLIFLVRIFKRNQLNLKKQLLHPQISLQNFKRKLLWSLKANTGKITMN